MKQRTLLLLAALCTFALVVATPAGAADTFRGTVPRETPEEALVAWFVQTLQPETLTLVLDGPPAPDGDIRHFYLAAEGARYEGIRISSVELEGMFVQCNPRSEWTTDRGPAIRSALKGSIRAVLTEKDLNDFLLQATLDDGDGRWSNFRLKLSPGSLYAKGYYRPEDVGMKILVELEGPLKLDEGTKIRLDDYSLKVNNAEKSSSIKRSIEKAQPLIDFSTFVLPVRLATLDTGGHRLLIASRVPPRSFDGTTYRYRQ